MRVTLYDVGHGSFSHLVSRTGRSLVVDCGVDAQRGIYPHEVLASEGVSRLAGLAILNWDEDHLGGLPQLIRDLPVANLLTNTSLSPLEVQALKYFTNGEASTAVSAYAHWASAYVYPGTLDGLLPDIRLRPFANPWSRFKNTNDLSLALFVTSGRFTILFAGDLERPSWLALLEDPQFRAALGDVTVLVAAHHGRMNGYCHEAFNHCRPDLVVISDKSIVHGTQEHNLYSRISRGVLIGDQHRRVLTTRNDGNISFHVVADQNTWMLSFPQVVTPSRIRAALAGRKTLPQAFNR